MNGLSRPRARLLLPLSLFLLTGDPSPEDRPNDAGLGVSEAEVFLHGVAEPKRRATISAAVSAALEHVVAAEGADVRSGEVLIELDARVARASAAAARRGVEATAALDHARAVEEAEAQLLKARASLRSAQEALEQARANLALEEAKLAQYTLRAPFDGTVSRVFADEGTTVGPSQELVYLVDLHRLEVELLLPLSLYGELQEGESYRLRAAAPVSRVLEAELTYVDPVLQPATRHMRCLFEIDNADGALPAGFTVELVRG